MKKPITRIAHSSRADALELAQARLVDGQGFALSAITLLIEELFIQLVSCSELKEQGLVRGDIRQILDIAAKNDLLALQRSAQLLQSLSNRQPLPNKGVIPV